MNQLQEIITQAVKAKSSTLKIKNEREIITKL